MLVVPLSGQCNGGAVGSTPSAGFLLCILSAFLDPEPNGDIVGKIVDAVILHGPQISKKKNRPRASRRKPVSCVCGVGGGQKTPGVGGGVQWVSER